MVPCLLEEHVVRLQPLEKHAKIDFRIYEMSVGKIIKEAVVFR
jgi:hypothetical protein